MPRLDRSGLSLPTPVSARFHLPAPPERFDGQRSRLLAGMIPAYANSGFVFPRTRGSAAGAASTTMRSAARGMSALEHLHRQRNRESGAAGCALSRAGRPRTSGRLAFRDHAPLRRVCLSFDGRSSVRPAASSARRSGCLDGLCFMCSSPSAWKKTSRRSRFEELRPEVLPQRLRDLAAHAFGRLAGSARRCNWLPRFDVMMTTVFLKSTVRPLRRSAARRRAAAA
jgi:hypothetical protein